MKACAGLGVLVLSAVVVSIGIGCGAGSEPAPTNSKQAVNSSLVGTFHLDGNVDATNLTIRADGTFEWNIQGCDFGGGNCGAWVADDAESIRLTPSAGSEFPHFGWINGVGATCGKDLRVRAATSHDGIVVEADTAQNWVRGGVCAECGGSLGPTGQKACDVPFTSSCSTTQNPNRRCD